MSEQISLFDVDNTEGMNKIATNERTNERTNPYCALFFRAVRHIQKRIY